MKGRLVGGWLCSIRGPDVSPHTPSLVPASGFRLAAPFHDGIFAASFASGEVAAFSDGLSAPLRVWDMLVPAGTAVSDVQWAPTHPHVLYALTSAGTLFAWNLVEKASVSTPGFCGCIFIFALVVLPWRRCVQKWRRLDHDPGDSPPPPIYSPTIFSSFCRALLCHTTSVVAAITERQSKSRFRTPSFFF